MKRSLGLKNRFRIFSSRAAPHLRRAASTGARHARSGIRTGADYASYRVRRRVEDRLDRERENRRLAEKQRLQYKNRLLRLEIENARLRKRLRA